MHNLTENELYRLLSIKRAERIERDTAYCEVFRRQPGEREFVFWKRFDDWNTLVREVVEWGTEVYGDPIFYEGGQFKQYKDDTGLVVATVQRRRADDTVIIE